MRISYIFEFPATLFHFLFVLSPIANSYNGDNYDHLRQPQPTINRSIDDGPASPKKLRYTINGRSCMVVDLWD